MSLKQIKWHAAVLAVAVIAALTVLFALATVTSNAADVVYDEATRTYTMSDSTYDQQILLEDGETTTIHLIGENKVTFLDPGDPGSAWCINGGGNLKITGSGTLETPNGGICCNHLTISDGAKLKGLFAPDVFGSVNIDNADIEATELVANFGDEVTDKININNTRIKTKEGLYLGGAATLTNCNVTIEEGSLSSELGELTIDGGTFNINQDPNNTTAPAILVEIKAIIKNAAIKTDSFCSIPDMEMTDSNLEITVTDEAGLQAYIPGALVGNNFAFSGSKVNIDGGVGYAGIFANQQLTMIDTEANAKGATFGIFGKEVTINHTGGTFQATDPSQATAAVAGIYGPKSEDQHDYTGKITLENAFVKEPVGGTVKNVKDPVNGDKQNIITAIASGNVPAKKVVLEADHTTHTWDAGKVTKQPTATEDGVRVYTCTVCGATKTESIPKLTPQAPAAGTDGTPFGKGASVAAAEAAILALPNDNDPAGTAFGLIQLKASKVTKNSINLKWKAVPGASKYILFANKCGTGNKYKKLAEVTGTSYTATQAAGAAIQKGTYYKFIMIAADSSGKVVSTSKTVHAATKGGKIGNHKKVTVGKSVTKKAKKLKKGKTLKLKAKAVPQAKKLKVRKHRGVMYETSNPAVAQVNGKGTVKGVGKGTCYIYAYAQNGTCAKVKVTVK